MQTTTKVTRRTATSAIGDPVSVLAFSGDVSSTSKDAILTAYHALDDASSKVLLDFTAVDYINSSGIAIIIQNVARSQQVRIAYHRHLWPERALPEGLYDGGHQ
jgi:anti-anti-sigma regulatory factor